MKLRTNVYTLSSYMYVNFRLDLLFDLGDIVAGGEVPSVTKVFRPEKACLT